MSSKDYLKYYQGKTILVTGGAGAIGSNLTRALGELGAKLVMVLDDLSSASRWNVPALANVMFVEGSILDEVELKRVFFEGPDLVFHLAALVRQPEFHRSSRNRPAGQWPGHLETLAIFPPGRSQTLYLRLLRVVPSMAAAPPCPSPKNLCPCT